MAANTRQKVVKLVNNAQLMRYLHSSILIMFFTLSISGQKFTPVASDKVYHIAAGSFSGLWGVGAAKSMQWSDENAALFGVGSSFAAGIGKELWDVSTGGQFDVNDISATVFGGVVTSGITYACLKIFKKKPIVYAVVDKQGFQVGYKKTLFKK